jgi:hypothetical protein
MPIEANAAADEVRKTRRVDVIGIGASLRG